jgi:uncharacterized protein YecT (DUF1311 family)
MKKIILITLLYFQSPLSYADFSHGDCMKNAATNIEMKECSWRAYSIANERLEILYSSLVNKYKAGETTDEISPYIDRLNLSQSSWIVYREANCLKSASSMSGGSGESLLYSECKLEMTKARIKEIEKMKNEPPKLLPSPSKFLKNTCNIIGTNHSER